MYNCKVDHIKLLGENVVVMASKIYINFRVKLEIAIILRNLSFKFKQFKVIYFNYLNDL